MFVWLKKRKKKNYITSRGMPTLTHVKCGSFLGHKKQNILEEIMQKNCLNAPAAFFKHFTAYSVKNQFNKLLKKEKKNIEMKGRTKPQKASHLALSTTRTMIVNLSSIAWILARTAGRRNQRALTSADVNVTSSNRS